MFTGSTKSPPPKTPQPERLDEVYAALRRGLQSYLQVHQLELDSLAQQIRENKRNGRLGFLYEQDKQVKAIERFMRRLEFHLSKVEELYDAYCIQRRLRDGASKMVAAFNSATGSKEARESLSEANKGFRECTEHMCSLESELESQMGEFHIKMKGLAGFARLCAGDQYEVLMRFGRQRWRLRGRVEVSNKQVWDSEDYVFLPLITELLSIKVTELKSLANHVVVGSVSCETLDLFSPLPQTVAVDINDLGTVKLNLEVTWSPFDKDDQISSTSTVSKRLLSNQSPPDTPSMREQVFYSLLKRQGEVDNGTIWSNSSESSDDSSSPAPAHHAHGPTQSHVLQTVPITRLSFPSCQVGASTPSLSSNQEEDKADTGEVFAEANTQLGSATPNGHPRNSTSSSLIGGINPDYTAADRASIQSAEFSEASEDLSYSHPDISSHCPRTGNLDLPESIIPEICVSAVESSDGALPQVSAPEDECPQAGAGTTDLRSADGLCSEAHSQGHACTQGSNLPKDLPAGGFPCSSSFIQEVETALESFDFLNSSDLDEDGEEGEQKGEEFEDTAEVEEHVKDGPKIEEKEEELEDVAEVEERVRYRPKIEEKEEKLEDVAEVEEHVKDRPKMEEKEEGEQELQEVSEEQETDGKQEAEQTYAGESNEEEGDNLEIFIEAPEGFRNSDEDCPSPSEVDSVEDLQELNDMTESEVPEETNEEVITEELAEESPPICPEEEEASEDEPSTLSNFATTLL